MEYITFQGKDYIHIQALAVALGVSTTTLYNWHRAGHLTFCWPLGRAMTFVNRETAERLMRLKITSDMGAFIKNVKV